MAEHDVLVQRCWRHDCPVLLAPCCTCAVRLVHTHTERTALHEDEAVQHLHLGGRLQAVPCCGSGCTCAADPLPPVQRLVAAVAGVRVELWPVPVAARLRQLVLL
jgi:hypothetical protein